jgi:hypothetical protein
VAAGPVAQQAAVAEPGAQREAAVMAEPVAQRQAAAEAPGAQQQVAVRLVQPLELSVEFAETMVGPQRAVSCSPMATMARQILAMAARRPWIRAALLSARVPESPVASAAKEKAAVDPRPVAYRLLAAAVVRLRPAAADRLWFQEVSFSVAVLQVPPVSAKHQATAGRPWFREASFSAPVLEAPPLSAKA